MLHFSSCIDFKFRMYHYFMFEKSFFQINTQFSKHQWKNMENSLQNEIKLNEKSSKHWNKRRNWLSWRITPFCHNVFKSCLLHLYQIMSSWYVGKGEHLLNQSKLYSFILKVSTRFGEFVVLSSVIIVYKVIFTKNEIHLGSLKCIFYMFQSFHTNIQHN